jgi:hypothetical protein
VSCTKANKNTNLIKKVNKKSLIKRLLKTEAINSISWPKEMKAISSLVERFPDPIFWNSISLSFKLNSLCWLLSDKGRQFLNIEYKKYKLGSDLVSKNEVYILGEKNIDSFENSDTLKRTSKISTRDFLNLWPKAKH